MSERVVLWRIHGTDEWTTQKTIASMSRGSEEPVPPLQSRTALLLDPDQEQPQGDELREAVEYEVAAISNPHYRGGERIDLSLHAIQSRLRAALESVQVEQPEGGEARNLKSLAQWLVSLDEPDSTERRTVTLTQIIELAKVALLDSAGEGRQHED